MSEYEIWNLIISAFVGAATMGAVFVALFQTKYPYKKKVKIKSREVTREDVTLVGKNGELVSPKAVSIIVTNIGNKPINFSSYELKIGKNLYKLGDLYNMNLFPFILNPDDSKEVFVGLVELSSLIIRHSDEFIFTNKRAKIYFTDSTGRKYKTKTPNKINYYQSLVGRKDGE